MKNTLSKMEQTLPASWKKNGIPQLVFVLFLALSIFAVGGGKLRAYHNRTANAFTNGQYSITADMQQRISAGANVITVAKKIPGVDEGLIQAAQQAVDAAEDLSSPSQAYRNNQQMETSIEALYDSALQLANADQKDALSEQHSEFMSRGTILRNSSYNELAKTFNEQCSAFPANLMGALWGVQQVEYFA